MRDWTDSLLRMGFGPSALPRSTPLEVGHPMLVGWLCWQRGAEHLPANEHSVLLGFHQPRRVSGSPGAQGGGRRVGSGLQGAELLHALVWATGRGRVGQHPAACRQHPRGVFGMAHGSLPASFCSPNLLP